MTAQKSSRGAAAEFSPGRKSGVSRPIRTESRKGRQKFSQALPQSTNCAAPPVRSLTKCDNSHVADLTTRSSVLRRSFRKDFPAAVRGEGVYVWDNSGKKYLDLSGSAAVNFIGHGVPEIAAAMAEQAAKIEFVHTSQFTTPVAEAYAEELLAFAGLDSSDNFRGGAVYFTCGGSESIETALKLARQ